MTDTRSGLIELAERHGLHLTPTGAKLDESGADFRVLHASDVDGVDWIVRAPRRPDAFERSRVEKRVLEMMRPRLAVAVPAWRIHSSEIIAYPRLDGEPAARIDMAAGGYVWRFDAAHLPDTFVRSLGKTLARVHATPMGDAAFAGVRSLTPAAVRREIEDRIARCGTVVSVPANVRARWAAWLRNDDFWPEHSVLVHGDLHPPHILVRDSFEVVGVIDWSEAHVGDPATDFALLYATMGREALASILGCYEEAGGRIWPHMTAHIAETWAAYPLTIAEFALMTGEEAPRQLAQHLIDATAAEMSASDDGSRQPTDNREESGG